ncbi:MAG: VOC family protein, partial [Actinomycetota bacterium]
MSDALPRLVATVLDTTDARGLAEFYRALLGFVYAQGDEPPDVGEPDPRGSSWLVLNDADGQPRLAVQQVETLPRVTWPSGPVPQQLHLDLGVRGRDELDVQRDRVVRLGGSVLE